MLSPEIPISLTAFATLLRDKLRFIWAKSHSVLLRRLGANVPREVCCYLTDTQFPLAVFPDRVLCFDLFSWTWKFLYPIDVMLDLQGDASVTFLMDCNVLACGGGNESKISAVLSSRKTVRIRDMIQGRKRHGLVYDPATKQAYAFGGRGLRSSEKYNAAADAWTSLLSMCNIRSDFTPCLHAGLIYLHGGETLAIEAFSTKTESYQQIAFPTILGKEYVSVVEKNALVILSTSCLTKVDLFSRQVVFSLNCYSNSDLWSCCTPIIKFDMLFIVPAQKTHCIAMDLLTGRCEHFRIDT